MKAKRLVSLVMWLGGFAVAVTIVPRLGAHEGITSKGEDVSTVRVVDVDVQAIKRAHAEKAERIKAESGLADRGAAFEPAVGAPREVRASKPGDGLSTIEEGVTETEPTELIRITPTDGQPAKLQPFSTIEQGPSELSASEVEKAERVLSEAD